MAAEVYQGTAGVAVKKTVAALVSLSTPSADISLDTAYRVCKDSLGKLYQVVLDYMRYKSSVEQDLLNPITLLLDDQIVRFDIWIFEAEVEEDTDAPQGAHAGVEKVPRCLELTREMLWDINELIISLSDQIHQVINLIESTDVSERTQLAAILSVPKAVASDNILEIGRLISNLFNLVEPLQAFHATRRHKGHLWNQRQKILAINNATQSTSLATSSVSDLPSPTVGSVFDFSDAGSTSAVSQFSELTFEPSGGDGMRAFTRSQLRGRGTLFSDDWRPGSPPSRIPLLKQEYFPIYALRWPALKSFLEKRFPGCEFEECITRNEYYLFQVPELLTSNEKDEISKLRDQINLRRTSQSPEPN